MPSVLRKVEDKAPSKKLDRHIGHRMRLRRSLLRMTQGQVAEILGITFQQVQKYEQGQNRISAGRLYEVSRFLGVPILYFFEGLESKSSSPNNASHTQVSEIFLCSYQDDAYQELAEFIRAYQNIANVKFRKSFIFHGPVINLRL